MKKKKKIFIVLLILFTLFVVCLPRLSYYWSSEEEGVFYSYPLHTDEWQHYVVASSLEDNFFSPQIDYYQNPEKIIDGSPVFHQFLFFFQKIGLSLDNFYILPVIQGVFLILVFFAFISLISNPLVGFISSLFFLSLRSDVSILGLLFFKPFVLGFGFCLLSLFFFQKKKKLSFGFWIFSLLSILCYPPLVVLLIIYPLVYGVVKYIENKKKEKKIREENRGKKNILLLIGLVLLVLFTLGFGLILVSGNIPLLKSKMFYHNLIGSWRSTGLIKYLGIGLLFFGLIGFIKNIKKRKLWTYYGLFIFFFLNFIFSLLFKTSFAFHYMRTLYLGGIILSFYAGLGVVYIYQRISEIKNKKVGKIFLSLIILGILISQITFLSFSEVSASPANHARWLRGDNFKALKYLDNLSDKKQKICHPLNIGTVITPLTGFKATSLPIALTGGMKNSYYEIKKAGDDCEKIKEIIKQEGYQLLWLENEISCSFLIPVFESDSVFIYQYQDF